MAKKKSSEKTNSNAPIEIRKPTFENSAADRLLERIKRKYGLDYTKQKAVTYKKMERFALIHELYSFDELGKLIQTDEKMETELINLLTVCETYFFREKDQIIHAAELIQSGEIKSLLCAPCSSGEEVYTLLLSAIQQGNIPKHLRITAIDINTNALETAERGCYSARSVSNIPKSLLDAFFTKKKEKFCIDPKFKRFIHFEQQNIFDESIFRLGKFDAIFSRNMMIYFTDEEKKRVLLHFKKMLNPHGILFVGHADITFLPDGFEKVYKNRTVFYKLLG